MHNRRVKKNNEKTSKCEISGKKHKQKTSESKKQEKNKIIRK